MSNDPALASDGAAALTGALHKARHGQLSLLELFQITEALNAAGHHGAAGDFYKTWVAFNDTNPLLHLAYFNYSVTQSQMGDIAGAVQSLRASVNFNPQFGAAHINLGRALEDSGLARQAIEQWRTFTEATNDITPERINHRLMCLQHIGRVMEGAGLLEDAETTLWQAMELKPERTEAGQHWSSLRQRQCKWPILTPSEHVPVDRLIDSMSPLTLGCYSDDPLFQLAKAYRYHKSLVGRPDTSGFVRKQVKQKTGTGQRLRIGYVSSDLREHAVGFALCEVLELHNKDSVEIFAYYSGDDRPLDATQNRIKATTDNWRDITAIADVDAARIIYNDDIDILIDVNGYTKNARTKIFAYRPAPVIVNFCGYPGTMGSPFHNYIIGDEHTVPPSSEIYYTEKVLRIACNQPVDRKRIIAQRPDRASAGLPQDAFVYASFNGMQKITENCFGRWMAILKATPGSVLWLLAGDEPVNQRLRQLAEQQGLDPQRLIYAPKAANPDHLARIGLADLFLDTFPYGAHSTAADAITMGLPVLTMPGKTFASRFCASIINAAGIPELACVSPDDYVARAIAFAQDPQSLAAIKTSLQEQRETSTLRDMPALAARLEKLYWQMQVAGERGETPVPDLTNLDLYYEIGSEILAQHVEFEDEESLKNRYLEKLATRDNYSPVAHDCRLWPQAK